MARSILLKSQKRTLMPEKYRLRNNSRTKKFIESLPTSESKETSSLMQITRKTTKTNFESGKVA